CLKSTVSTDAPSAPTVKRALALRRSSTHTNGCTSRCGHASIADARMPEARMTLKQAVGRAVVPRLPITRFLFDQLRVEAAAATVKMTNAASPTRRRRLAEVAGGRHLLVNVACGPHVLEGFVNLDLYAASKSVIRWDCRRTLPLSDQTAAGIRVEHFVEHLEPRE